MSPKHPTDGELAAAIDRGIADGSIIELTPEMLDKMARAVGLNTPPRAPGDVDTPPCDCCDGDPNTVCAACGEHSCWAGFMYCEDYKSAGTRRP